MKKTPQPTPDRQDALAWIAGRLVWDSRLTELRTGEVDHKIRAASHRAA